MRPSMIISIPIKREHHQLIKSAAKAEERNMAAWVRYLIYQELRRIGYVKPDEETN